MPDRIDCPVPQCTGRVVSKRYENYGLTMFCDGPDAHSETTIRNAFARWDDELDGIDPEAADELLRRADPVEFLRDQVYAAGRRRSGTVRVPTRSMLIPPPGFPTGLGGVLSGRLLEYRGLTLLSGKASAGKTWSAIRASLDAARQGWDVVYLAAEGAAVVQARVDTITETAGVPDAWAMRAIDDGTPFEAFVSFLADMIRTERTLFVIDSFSTMLRLTEADDVDYWAHHRRMERLLFNIRQQTAGCVGLLVLSEANASGETKGRSFDHIADLSVNFAKDDEDPETKRVTVVKSWWGRVGDAGCYVVKPRQGGLIAIPGESVSVEEQRGYSYAVGGDDAW